MLWALGVVSLFISGGLSGIWLGQSAVDIPLHDTKFVTAHFHLIMAGAALFGVFGATTLWFPKMFGRMMSEKLGKIHFWGTVIPFNLIFIPMFFLGAAGDHRRIFDYTNFPDLARPELQALRIIATVSLVVMLLFQFVFLYNFINSLFRGARAGKNPWRSNTLEWTTDSPPPHGNWAKMPTCYRGPYEYSVPGRAQDFWPQDEPA
jgi:cytochrome c oxidase subunit 1